MVTFVIVSVVGGLVFGVLDAVINANPLARRLLAPFQPIMRASVNPAAGIVIDLVYGFVMAGVFVVLYDGLPGETGLMKGVSLAFLVWFFRVVMSAASQWMMFRVPARTVAYSIVTGLAEMLVLGCLYGLTLEPWD